MSGVDIGLHRNGTSRAHAGSSSGKPRRLGPSSTARPYDPAVTLGDARFVQKALLQALQEGDFESLIGIYRAHLRVLNRSHTAKALHVSRQFVHKMIKSASDPSLRTFTAFMRLLGGATHR